MKKIFIMVLLCAIANGLKAQYASSFTGSPVLTYIYVGSLGLSETDLSNAEKIQVDVFGGGWGSIDIGVTTFYIANRAGLNIHEVRLGGPNNNMYTLQAFDNGTNNIDFYIVTQSWSAFALKSYVLNGSIPVSQPITNTMTNSVPGTPHAITIVPVLVTDDNGNMGIKTENMDPDYALTVNGGIRAKEVRIETGWADYVFDKGYLLKPLKEVENYIKINKHLPEVPTTEEVAKDGSNVGQTEVMLLKKVEELTLYILQQQKQIDQLKRSIKTSKITKAK